MISSSIYSVLRVARDDVSACRFRCEYIVQPGYIKGILLVKMLCTEYFKLHCTAHRDRDGRYS